MKVAIFVDRVKNPGSPAIEGARIGIQSGQIVWVRRAAAPARGDIVFRGHTCVPAFINSHDHLKYTWPERIGNPPYSNSYEWLPTLYSEASKLFLGRLTLEDLYWLGTYKNLLSGATTVGNHCRPLPDWFLPRYPLRILSDFKREIFVRPDPRAHLMGAGVRLEAKSARRQGVPFVVHLAEGVDEVTAVEVAMLEAEQGLFERAVLIHAVNISDGDIARIARSEATVVWCPRSNDFLFGRTSPIQKMLDRGVKVALGTDSSCTGSEDLLEEMRVAWGKLAEFMSQEDAAESVVKMVTSNGAGAYGLSGKVGLVAEGFCADLVILRVKGTGWVDVVESKPSDIAMVMCEGRPLLAHSDVADKLNGWKGSSSAVHLEGSTYRVTGDPAALVTRVAAACGRERSYFPLGRRLWGEC